MDPDPLFPSYGRDPNRNQFHSSHTPFRLDEGFSEESYSQDDNGRFAHERVQEWVMAQNENTRMEIAYEILHSLRTSNIAAVVERLTPLLHMDPTEKLPAEIISEIFSYLDASTLLTASLASHTWRARVLDSRLWQSLYSGQGWGADSKEIRSLESVHTSRVRSEFKKARGQFRLSESRQPQPKKRATGEWNDVDRHRDSEDVTNWREQHGAIEADVDAPSDSDDQEMQDAPLTTQHSPQRPNKRQSQDSGDEMDIYPEPNSSTLAQIGQSSNDNQEQPFKPRLTIHDSSGAEKLNWSYLYKQRQRLEENWTKGRYTNFQLPDPAYPHEAHSECVYTIQFYGKWLVSGSRDKTLRVWDLETRRLRGKPLTGHCQSVLCLQFDPTEEEDVIISGSSDSSVIVWKFSTGQKIFEIPSAHEESVLNLRFDKRYLVTCSKDKKIKVWNRQAISPTSSEYPRISPSAEVRVPSYIVDVNSTDPSLLEAKLASGAIKALRPYTHLMTFAGHNAAVNAIQINGDLVVSASGDRLIKVWNVRTGKMVRTLSGHQKGIACVQFDSKRIVSGSSDNSVRIFDPTTGSEVAELKGHTNLVRTVQAGFGDLPGSEEEDLMKAKAAEQKFEEDVAAGIIANDHNYGRRVRNGEFGTSRITFGSRLPPGGGGSKWGKIVSGSYDESIIIWRKNAQGDWVVGQILRQESAVRAANSEQQSSTIAVDQSRPNPAAQRQPRARPSAQGPPRTTAGPSNTSILSPSQIMQQAVNTSFASLGTGLSNVMGIARNINAPLAGWNVPPRSSSGGQMIPPLAPGGTAVQQAMNQFTAQANYVMTNAVNAAMNQPQQNPPTFHQQTTQNTNPQGLMSPAVIGPSAAGPSQQQNVPPQTQPPTQPTPHDLAHASAQQQLAVQQQQQQQQQAQQAQQAQQQQLNQQNGSVSRVFKLQFDARRIVCCSQDSRIIGWDFANGDPDIMNSCRFFLAP